ncbi:MAG: hypothetical protein ABSG41_10715 [Bryobacteraceae bacterium]|jgi:hypothetical protein
MTPARKPSKLYRVTYAGRVEVDTNSLVYSKEGQRIMADADRKIGEVNESADTAKKTDPDNDVVSPEREESKTASR